MIYEVKLVDTLDCKIKKSKGHSIELDGDVIIWRANYLASQRIEGEWKDRWRCWDETCYKKHVIRYGYIRVMFANDNDLPEAEEEWKWEFKICIAGADDIVLMFDTRDDVQEFHEEFKKFMNQK